MGGTYFDDEQEIGPQGLALLTQGARGPVSRSIGRLECGSRAWLGKGTGRPFQVGLSKRGRVESNGQGHDNREPSP